MKKLILLMILAMSLVNVAIPAWGAGHINSGDVFMRIRLRLNKFDWLKKSRP